jgi:hypothetical protein
MTSDFHNPEILAVIAFLLHSTACSFAVGPPGLQIRPGLLSASRLRTKGNNLGQNCRKLLPWPELITLLAVLGSPALALSRKKRTV